MYGPLGICLALTGLLVISSLVSAMTVVIWRVLSRKVRLWPAPARAQFLFFLLIAPWLTAVLCVLLLFVPSYLIHEPHHTNEVVTVELALLAAISFFGIGRAACRSFLSCRATHRLVRDWLKHAEPIKLTGVGIPAFRIPHRFPVFAVVGVLRPRLFVADEIVRSLSSEELSAAIAHEFGHLSSHDNFKQGLLRMCRDILPLLPLTRSMDCEWYKAAEAAADDHAARGNAAAALELATALVKVSRLVPEGSKPSELLQASLLAEDPGCVAMRVHRLTAISDTSDIHRKEMASRLNVALGLSLAGISIVTAILYASDMLARIHSALELVVSFLQ